MSTSTRPRSTVRPVAAGLYQTPAGRLCKLVKFTRDEDGTPQAEMAYAVLGDPLLNRGDCFTLAQRAWHLLVRVG